MKVRSILLFLYGLYGLYGLCACAPPDRRYVAVRVTGLTPEMTVLGLEVAVDGRKLTGEAGPAQHPVRRECGEGIDCFVLQLPDGWSGGLQVAIEARGLLALPWRGEAQGPLGWGEREMALGGTETAIEVPLSRYALWTLTRGQGAVSILPGPALPGGGCGEGCQVYQLPIGQDVSVTAAAGQPDRAYLAGFQGACHGLAPCALTMRGPRALGAAFAARPCLESGFCWEHPLPQGNSLRAVAVAAPDRAYAVGDAGTVLAWDGAVWSLWRSGTGETLLGAAALGGDLFAVSKGGSVLRCAAGSCQPEFSGTKELRAIAAGGGVLVAVGVEGTVLERRLGSFGVVSGVPKRDLSGVWVSPAGDRAHAVGRGGEVHNLKRSMPTAPLMWDGMTLVPGQNDLLAVWGDGTGMIYAAGIDGVFRGQEGAWMQMGNDQEKPLLRQRLALWGGGGAVWALGLSPRGDGSAQRFDGTRWQEVSQGAPIWRGVAGSGAADVWLAGDGGTLAQSRDGAKLSPFSRAAVGPQVTLHALADGGPLGLFAVGSSGTLLRRVESGWAQQQHPGEADRSLFAAAAGGGKVFAAGEAGTLLEYNGTAWSRASAPGLNGTYIWYALAAHEQHALVAGKLGGGGVIWERSTDGSNTWALLSNESRERRGLAAGPRGEFLATGVGPILRYRSGTGGLMDQMTMVDGTFHGAARLDVGRFLVAGEGLAGQGLVLSGDNGSWVSLALPAEVPRLYAVAASAEGAWAVGEAGVILARAGTAGAWGKLSSGVALELRGAVASGSTIYLVGAGAAVLRRTP